MANWRALCEELVRHAETAQSIAVGEGLWDGDEDEGLLNRARAALAQPEPEVVELSDESVEAAAQVIYGSMRFDRVDSTSDWVPNGNSFAQDEARRCAHAVLSRFGRPAPAPAGELGELVAWLTEQAVQAADGNHSQAAGMLTWAAQVVGEHADLLERQAAPVPVAVSERLPGPEDCDAEGRCWMGYGENEINGLGHLRKTWFWTLEDLSMVDEYTHWRPYNTMPLPSGEVDLRDAGF